MIHLSAALALMAPSPQNSMLQPLVMFGGIFAIFYFLMIRPQQKQRHEHEELLKQLKKGDRVVTAGGIIGDVIFIGSKGPRTAEGEQPQSNDDEITIKSAESRIIIERGRIVKVLRKGAEVTSA
jgi:preprotein translocase subunit YajC